MQTETIDATDPVDDIHEVDTESPEADQHIQALEAEFQKIEASLLTLEDLESQQGELQHALDQAGEKERAILSDATLSEAQGVKKLVEVRARKDLRQERLLAHKKRITAHIDLILFDVAPVVREAFAIFINGLLNRKAREIQELFDSLLPPHAIPGLDNKTLTWATTPIKRLEQIAYSIGATPPKDPQAALEELKRLPARWLSELRRVIEEESE
jgi:hypothetical protein